MNTHDKLVDELESAMWEVKSKTFSNYVTLDYIRSAMRSYAETYANELSNPKENKLDLFNYVKKYFKSSRLDVFVSLEEMDNEDIIHEYCISELQEFHKKYMANIKSKFKYDE